MMVFDRLLRLSQPAMKTAVNKVKFKVRMIYTLVDGLFFLLTIHLKKSLTMTQIVETNVGVDLMLQRAGRLNKHFSRVLILAYSVGSFQNLLINSGVNTFPKSGSNSGKNRYNPPQTWI